MAAGGEDEKLIPEKRQPFLLHINQISMKKYALHWIVLRQQAKDVGCKIGSP